MIFILFVLNQSMVTKQIIIDRHWQLNLWNWSWRCVSRLLKNKDKFDNSDYPENTLFDETNKRADVKYKDKAANTIYYYHYYI